MSAHLSVNDAATWRSIKNVDVNDVGTWRTIKKVYINDAGTWRTVFQNSLLSATLTDGTDSFSGAGYAVGTFGDLSPSTDSNGYSVDDIFISLFDSNTRLAISGFSSDPGQGYISSVSVNGVSHSPGDGQFFGYSYSAGQAIWGWTGNPWGFTGGGSTYPVLILP